MRVSKVCGLLVALVIAGCGSDDAKDPSGGDGRDAGERSGSGGTSGGAGSAESGSGGAGGAAGRRSGLSCERSSQSVQCGGQTCPMTAEFEQDPCFVPCCLMFEGKEQCGFRGTSRAFTTECVLPAMADPTCDEVPQFQGCCEPTRGVCGIVGGFAPGCQTKSNFVTLPASPKACGGRDADAGDVDAG